MTGAFETYSYHEQDNHVHVIATLGGRSVIFTANRMGNDASAEVELR